jgi:hypothetical protein
MIFESLTLHVLIWISKFFLHDPNKFARCISDPKIIFVLLLTRVILDFRYTYSKPNFLQIYLNTFDYVRSSSKGVSVYNFALFLPINGPSVLAGP